MIAAAGKQPALFRRNAGVMLGRPRLPPLPQQVEDLGRQHHMSVLAAFRLHDADDHLLTVDVARPPPGACPSMKCRSRKSAAALGGQDAIASQPSKRPQLRERIAGGRPLASSQGNLRGRRPLHHPQGQKQSDTHSLRLALRWPRRSPRHFPEPRRDDVYDACLVLNDRSRHTVHRFMSCPLRSVSERPRLEVRLEDRFQYELERTLRHPVADRGNRQDTDLAAILRDKPPTAGRVSARAS